MSGFGRKAGASQDRVVELATRSAESEPDHSEAFRKAVPFCQEAFVEGTDAATLRSAQRRDLAQAASKAIDKVLADRTDISLTSVERRDMVTLLLNAALGSGPVPDGLGIKMGLPGNDDQAPAAGSGDDLAAVKPAKGGSVVSRASVEEAKEKIQQPLMERIDVAAASKLPRADLAQQIGEVVGEILHEERIQLNLTEQRDLVTMLLNDMLGLGPLEPLLADDSITDIMVNGPKQVYIEKGGKLTLTDVVFRDNSHVMNIATRIVNRIGRRVDETSPLCDARLEDGSRVNVIAPPLAIDGASISIRKFSEKKITLDVMEKQGNMSPEMATILRIAGRCRLNIIISGGTGSGKTTLLNALSQMVDTEERVVTIEDAAELQLQQPHVVRLETRPPNLEGTGEITMRDLVKNALRMRPDRIILGEVRGAEALDMLQAMNTGHEGSMGTIHANSPREGLTRLENMIAMAKFNLPPKAVRQQICDAVDMIVQVTRMRDGIRRITNITEIVGMEGDVITTQELFVYTFEGEDKSGKLIGNFESGNLRPHFTPKAEYFGLGPKLMQAI